MIYGRVIKTAESVSSLPAKAPPVMLNDSEASVCITSFAPSYFARGKDKE